MSQSVPWPSPARAWLAVALLNLAYLVAFADRIILSLLIGPIQSDLGLTDTQIGLLSGIAFGLCFTLCGLPAGWLVDRAPRVRLIAAGIAFWSLATAACGLVRGFPALFAARLAVGVGEATLHPAANSTIADLFPPAKRPRAYAAYMMAGAAGTFVAFLGGGALVSALGEAGTRDWPLLGTLRPWQEVFVIVGLPGVLLALLLLLVVREPARRQRANAVKPTFADLTGLLKQNRATFACTMLGAPILLVGSYALVTWLSVFFGRVHGWTPGETGVRFALTAGVAGIVGTLALGRLIERLQARGLADATFLVCLGGGLILNLCGAAAMFASSPWVALALLTVSGFFLLAPGLAAMACVNEITPNELRGQVSALYTLAAGLITNTLGPFMVGVLTDSVFGDPARINHSLALLLTVSAFLGGSLILVGLRPYRLSVARQAIAVV